MVLGNTRNTTDNGVPLDYAYGAARALANSLDAFRISRVCGSDTLTVDRTQYAQASISAKDGVARELKNPAQLEHGRVELGGRGGDRRVRAGGAGHSQGTEPLVHAVAAGLR